MTKRMIRIVLEALSLLIVLGTIIFLIVYWKHIPDQVPMRFDGKGQIESWSAKPSLLALPVLSAVVYVSLFFGKTMRFRSLGKAVRVPVPELMFPAMKLPLLAGISYVTVCAALVRPLGVWFFPVFLVLVLAPMAVFCVIVWPSVMK